MIAKTSERVQLTLSKKQAKWLKDNAKRLNITVSDFVKWLLDKNIGHLINRLPREDLEYLIKVAKFNWLDFEEDNDIFK